MKPIKKDLEIKDFRVTIFGSSRVKKNDDIYKEIKTLSRMLGEEGISIVTGGGPGIMKAANKGHNIGKRKSGKKSDSIGLLIELPREQKTNKYVDIKKNFQKILK